MRRVTVPRLALCLMVLALGAGAFPKLSLAQTATGFQDLENVQKVQNLSLFVDDLYAPSLESIVSGDFGQGVQFREDSAIAYGVTGDRTHYVVATQLPAGQVAVRSDETGPVTCAEYSVECVSRVTSDPELLAVLPIWVES
jgi:hypothetical protein